MEADVSDSQPRPPRQRERTKPLTLHPMTVDEALKRTFEAGKMSAAPPDTAPASPQPTKQKRARASSANKAKRAH